MSSAASSASASSNSCGSKSKKKFSYLLDRRHAVSSLDVSQCSTNIHVSSSSNLNENAKNKNSSIIKFSTSEKNRKDLNGTSENTSTTDSCNNNTKSKSSKNNNNDCSFETKNSSDCLDKNLFITETSRLNLIKSSNEMIDSIKPLSSEPPFF